MIGFDDYKGNFGNQSHAFIEVKTIQNFSENLNLNSLSNQTSLNITFFEGISTSLPIDSNIVFGQFNGFTYKLNNPESLVDTKNLNSIPIITSKKTS